MKPMIKYKVDFDFIAFMHVCANAKDLKKKMDVEMKQHQEYKDKSKKKKKDQFYKDCEVFYKETLSYIQRNELDMFFKKTSIFKDYLTVLAMQEKELENETVEDFKQHILKLIDFDEEKLQGDNLINELKNHYDDPNSIDDYHKESELILETLKDDRMFNEIFKNAIACLKELFIQEKYLPMKAEIEAKLEEHNKEYAKDPIKFILKISSGIIKEEDLKKSDVQTYMTFMTYYSIMVEMTKDFSVIVYHKRAGRQNSKEMEKHVMQSLLKFLSDPKRYEMIQMLSKERWYANELAKKFEITPATMSYHVNKLFALGLISFEPAEQNKMYIQLDKTRLDYLLNQLLKDLTN